MLDDGIGWGKVEKMEWRRLGMIVMYKGNDGRLSGKVEEEDKKWVMSD